MFTNLGLSGELDRRTLTEPGGVRRRLRNQREIAMSHRDSLPFESVAPSEPEPIEPAARLPVPSRPAIMVEDRPAPAERGRRRTPPDPTRSVSPDELATWFG
jgi:hypothetical protein